MSLISILSANPTAPVVAVSAVVALVSFRSQRHLTRAKHTLDFEKDFKERELKNLGDARRILNTLSEGQLIELGRTKKDPPAEFQTLTAALNVWERVAIAIKYDVFSEELLLETYGSSVVWLFIFSLPFVRERQKYNSRVYTNFSWLGVRWMQKVPLPSHDRNRLAQREAEEKRLQMDSEARLHAEIRKKVLAEIAAGQVPPGN